MSELFSQSSQLDSQARSLTKTAGEQFLKFHLHPNTRAMLPIRQITEVLKIQFGQIVPIPHMPAWVMGVYNWRGDILWMVDLGHLIGLNSWYRGENNRSYYTAIVLSPNKEKGKTSTETNLNLGLVISKIEDIEVCEREDIQIPPNSLFNSQIASFIAGYWLQPEGDAISVLDGKAIVAAMPANATN